MWLERHGARIDGVALVMDDPRGDSYLLNFYYQLARRWRD
jgi:hypothetical protein